MASYTTSLRFVQPADGAPNWGATVNNGLTALVDTSVAGTASIVMTPANYTLSNNNGASDEARAMFLALSGSPGGTFNVIVPAVSKLYFVSNSTGHAQIVKTSAGLGTSVPNNSSMTLRCDGTNVVEALNYFGSLTLGAALPVASGGTGSTSLFTANGVAYASGTTTLATGSNLVFDNANIRLGIGTNTPLSGLHVSGAIPSTNRTVRVESTSTSSAQPPFLTFARTTTTGSTVQSAGSILWSRTLTDSTTDTPGQLSVSGNNNAGSTTGTFRFDALTRYDFYTGGVERLRIEASYVKQNVLTVATLTSASVAGAGARAFVSDANATTFSSVVVGGGANNIPVYSDGTNWRIG